MQAARRSCLPARRRDARCNRPTLCTLELRASCVLLQLGGCVLPAFHRSCARMRSDHVLGLSSRGFHHMRYYEWGDPTNPRLVVCVHGLTRTGRDFDVLAEALSPYFRVVCPDIVGRGQSDWLEAKEDYNYAQYMADLTVLLAKVNGNNHNKIDWVGTS